VSYFRKTTDYASGLFIIILKYNIILITVWSRGGHPLPENIVSVWFIKLIRRVCYSCALKFIGIIIGHINWTLFVDQKRRDVTSLTNFSPDLLRDVITYNVTFPSILCSLLQFCGPHLITKIKYSAVDFESRRINCFIIRE